MEVNFNMANPLVSIIIPIYNTEKYVGKAIESVLNQTYDNIELILVNDGSSDNSGNICEEYTKKDNRIIILNQKNAGVSNARNTGLARAKGEFIEFIDSDDEIHVKKTEILVKTMLENDVDIVFCGFELKGRINKTVRSDTKVYGRDDFLCKAYKEENLYAIIGSSVTCLLKRKIIADEKIIFNNEFTVGEDGFFILKYLSYCNKVYVTKEVFYQCNRYEVSDRVSIMSHTAKDICVFYILYFKKFINIIKYTSSEKEINALSQKFFNQLIPSLIILMIYNDSSPIELVKKIKGIIDMDIVHQSSISYKRGNKEHSYWIPIFIKYKLTIPLYVALKVRGRRHASIYGKNEHTISVYRKNNN